MKINELILKNLPHKPGIYIFKNDKKEILYVGKAKNLQKRVSSYFSKSRDTRANITFLMKEASYVDFTSTNNEEEAKRNELDFNPHSKVLEASWVYK